MCPFEQRDRDFMGPDIRRPSQKTCKNGNPAEGTYLVNVVEEFGTTAEELCQLMQLRGVAVKEHIDAEYGSTNGLCALLRTSPTEGKFPISLLLVSSLCNIHWIFLCRID